MSRRFYQMELVREQAREVRGRNKGIARATKVRKRVEAETRALRSGNVEYSKVIREDIARRQPERYELFNSGSTCCSILLRIDLQDNSYYRVKALGL